MLRRIGGGILMAVSATAPVIVDKMDIHLENSQGRALLIACGVLTLFGLIMALWPEKKESTESALDQRVTSHRQSGGITARTVNMRHDER